MIIFFPPVDKVHKVSRHGPVTILAHAITQACKRVCEKTQRNEAVRLVVVGVQQQCYVFLYLFINFLCSCVFRGEKNNSHITAAQRRWAGRGGAGWASQRRQQQGGRPAARTPPASYSQSIGSPGTTLQNRENPKRKRQRDIRRQEGKRKGRQLCPSHPIPNRHTSLRRSSLPGNKMRRLDTEGQTVDEWKRCLFQAEAMLWSIL